MAIGTATPSRATAFLQIAEFARPFEAIAARQLHLLARPSAAPPARRRRGRGRAR